MSEYTIDPERYAAITLGRGMHETLDEGTCLMEAVAYLVGEEHSDSPACVSPILGEFGRSLNDVLSHDLRQELRGLIPSLPGTVDDGMDEKRGYMALDWLVRTWLPTWLELSPERREDAREIRELDRITDRKSGDRARLVLSPMMRTRRRYYPGFIEGEAFENSAFSPAYFVVSEAEIYNASLAWDAQSIAVDPATGASPDSLDRVVGELQLSAIDLFAEMIKSPR